MKFMFLEKKEVWVDYNDIKNIKKIKDFIQYLNNKFKNYFFVYTKKHNITTKYEKFGLFGGEYFPDFKVQVIYINDNIRYALKNKKNFNNFLLFLNEMIEHEKVHNKQFKANPNLFIGEKDILDDIELEAYARQFLEEFKNNFEISEDFYISEFEEDDPKKIMYTILKNPKYWKYSKILPFFKEHLDKKEINYFIERLTYFLKKIDNELN